MPRCTNIVLRVLRKAELGLDVFILQKEASLTQQWIHESGEMILWF